MSHLIVVEKKKVFIPVEQRCRDNGGMYFMTEEYLPSVKRLDNDKAHQLLLKPELVKYQ